MQNLFHILTVASVVVMTISILMQTQGVGLGTAFGGEGGSYRTKRGAEKIIFNLTIVMAIVFVLSVVFGILSKP
ncbi:MAG: preprotein translocase subunit SecG [Candidatus Saccharimonadia bacterium]